MVESTSPDFIPLRQSNTTKFISNNGDFNLTSVLDADKLRSCNGIEVDGHDVPVPFQSFEEMGISASYVSYLRRINVVKPTPIQMQAISCLLHHRDVIGISSTGSGKTFAYILPMLDVLQKHVDTLAVGGVSPLCLILVPSRELMTQVLKNICDFLDTKKAKVSSLAKIDYDQTTINLHLPQHQNNFPNHSLHNSFSTVQEVFSYGSQGYSRAHDVHKVYNSNYLHEVDNYVVPSQQKLNQTGNLVVGLCGGVPIANDLAKLDGFTKVVVATPGRLVDLCDRNKLSLSKIKYFVIDECDKLLDMGLEEQLRKIVAMVTVHGTSLQTSLWSATLPESLERIARSAVVDPIYICAGIKHVVSANIKQNIIFMHSYMKHKKLLGVVRQIPYPPIIIFVLSKHKADEVTELLQREQFHAAAIHSGKDQDYRNEIMSSFMNGDIDVLVCTDLISRGMHMPTVTHVINFDTPNTIEDYLHRCGRTGRMGRVGATTTFLTLDCKIAKELKEMLVSTNNTVPIELLDTSIFGKHVLSTEMGDRVVE